MARDDSRAVAAEFTVALGTRSAAKADAQRAIDAASGELARGAIDEPEWQQRVASALADSYLRERDPRWQSGFDGDDALWRQARALVLDAVPGGGSLLDVGCANGYLMECLASWGHERGIELSVYGLELSPALAAMARSRLPALAEHIYSGNASDWTPPRRFTYVRTGLEYVAAGNESFLIARLLRDVVEPGGRLIVGPVNEPALTATVDAFERAGVPGPAVASAIDRNGKTRHVVWAVNSLRPGAF